MSRYITYLRWQVRLWLAGLGRAVTDRTTQLAVSTTYDNDRFGRFVDRVSPWRVSLGYDRLALRRLLYTLRHPIEKQRFWSLALVESIVYRLVERPSLGRYEAWNPRWSMKAEWLDSHIQYVDRETGSTDWYQWVGAFFMVDVPWSLKPESWLISVDGRGFVYATQFPKASDVEREFEIADQSYTTSLSDDVSDAFMDMFDNPEGEPTINGAFR